MTTLTASQIRIPPENFNQVAYRDEVLCVRHRGGRNVYIISEDDMAILEAAKNQRDAAIRAASKRVGERHHETMRRLSQ